MLLALALLCSLGLGLEQAKVAQAAVAFAQAEGQRLGGEHTLRVLSPPQLPPMRPGAFAATASSLSKREPIGRFFVVVKLSVEGRPAGLARVDLEGQWKGPLLRVRQNLPRKTELTQDMVELAEFEGIPPEGALGELPQGYRLRNGVAAGRFLGFADVEAIPLVQAGERVRLVAESGPISIAIQAVAKGNGRMNERIRVEIDGTRKHLMVRVVGPGQARLDIAAR